MASTCDTIAGRCEEPSMRLIAIRLAASSVLPCLALAVAAAEQAALSRMPPEARARMAEAMKARGVSMPDAHGATKACLTKETFEAGAWQQVASDAGCTSNFSTQSATMWKWHSSCTTLKSQSDGETVFNNAESYKTKVTTTSTVMGKTKTSTRILQGKWIGADCGDIKPLTLCLSRIESQRTSEGH